MALKGKGNFMSKMIFVNLPVRDLKASTAFYTALGGALNPQFSGENSSCMMFSDTIGVMLLTHERYSQFIKRPIGDARRRGSQPCAGSRIHVQPQRRGPRRECVGDHVDGPCGARQKRLSAAPNSRLRQRPDSARRN